METNSERAVRMLALVQRAHERQSRNNGRVPYWMHVVSVGQIVDWACGVTGEIGDATLREDLYLAAMGHDLYEDTEVQPRDIQAQFGARVDALIRGLTNEGGDRARGAYLQQLARADEEVRLIKLADVTENTASCSYAIPDMGLDWTKSFYLPIAIETAELLRRTPFTRYPRTAELLRTVLAYNLAQLERAIALTERAEQRSYESLRPTRRLQITNDLWQASRERKRERERAEHARAPRLSGRISIPADDPGDDE